MSHLRKVARSIARYKGIPYYKLKAKLPKKLRGWGVSEASRMIGWPWKRIAGHR